MNIVDGFKNYYSALGARGVLLAVRARVIPSWAETTVCHPEIAHPIHLRLRTSDLPTFRHIIVEREYDFGFELPDAATIIDAGANVGMASVYFASRFPTARIVAIEPHTGNFRMLQKNVAGYPNIACAQVALWSKPQKMKIIHEGRGTCGLACEPDDNGAINAVTIDQLMTRFGINKVDLLKMDIEGAEKGLFECCESWLPRVQRILIELHDRYVPGCSDAFFAAMAQFKFESKGEYIHAWR